MQIMRFAFHFICTKCAWLPLLWLDYFFLFTTFVAGGGVGVGFGGWWCDALPLFYDDLITLLVFTAHIPNLLA